MSIYIVTEYGCNCSLNDMWIPRSRLFINHADAYEYFISRSPSIDDKYIYYKMATQYVNCSYDPNSDNKEYTIIEDRHQLVGEDWNYAKRPFGALVARCGM